MSSVDLDGSHTATLCGGECCGYQGRKKRTTTNAIYVTDRQRMPLAMSTPISGSHNDLYNISEVLRELFSELKASGLSVSSLFLNVDAGFDSVEFWRICHQQEVFPNVAFNKRRGMYREDKFIRADLQGEIQHWKDQCVDGFVQERTEHVRHHTSQLGGWNYIAFILILMKR